MNPLLSKVVNQALEPFAGSGVRLDAQGRLCLPDGLDAARVHRFIELVLERSFESPKDALRDLFRRVGVAPEADRALGELLADDGRVDLGALRRNPVQLGRSLTRLLEVPARFRTFLIHDLGLADPHGSTLEEAVVSTRERAAAALGCDAEWDAILARPVGVAELARPWREIAEAS